MIQLRANHYCINLRVSLLKTSLTIGNLEAGWDFILDLKRLLLLSDELPEF